MWQGLKMYKMCFGNIRNQGSIWGQDEGFYDFLLVLVAVCTVRVNIQWTAMSVMKAVRKIIAANVACSIFCIGGFSELGLL
jgi:hypothetical protein